MTKDQMMKNLEVPNGRIDVVIDSDAYNEIDDQFAISYLLKSTEKLNTVALYAAPFSFTDTPTDVGMEKSYLEILNLLELMGERREVFRGAKVYLKDEKTPVISDAALDLAKRVENYSADNPLYVVAIGAITNIASAILMNPEIKEKCVVVWLGGHSREYPSTDEYNMRQDIAAARVVMSSGVPFIQLPCCGVANAFSISKCELEKYFLNRTPVSNYLAEHTFEAMAKHSDERWTRVLWDVTAVVWLLNDGERFMLSKTTPVKLPGYDSKYEKNEIDCTQQYVYHIWRDALMKDLIDKITG